MSAEQKKSSVLAVSKALVLALVFTLAFILIFALVMQWCDVPSAWVTPMNQVIKGVSLLLACLISFRGASRGWRKGLVLGIVYVIVAWVLFSALSGEWTLGWSALIDLATGAMMGLLSGAIAVNARSRATA